MAKTLLGNKAVGSVVKIKVNGSNTNFIVIHQGSPSSSYGNASGTWLCLQGTYGSTAFEDSYSNKYNTSVLQSYVSGYLNLIDSTIRNQIKQITIPCTSSGNISAKVFALSATEVGLYHKYYMNVEGVTLSYFNSDSRRATGTAYWTRTPYAGSDGKSMVFAVGTGGSTDYHGYANSYATRPAFVLPTSLVVADDGTVSVNHAPTISGSGTSLGTKSAPFSFTYTVSDADGDKLTITEKLDGNTVRTLSNVSSGTTTTFAYASNADTFQQMLNGSHTINVTVSDGTASASYSASFTKSVTSASITLSTPLAANAVIKAAVLSLDASIPDDATLKIEMTNNGKDSSPVWEDATKDVQQKVNHLFTNKTAANGFAFNFRITVSRGSSGASGYIRNIGGAFE